MENDGETTGGVGGLLNRMATRKRPWQIMLTGNATDPVSIETREALARILDLMPGVGHLVLRTADGGVLNATRDYSGDYLAEVDRRIAAIFSADPQITAIAFPKHTATPDDPHWSPNTKALAAIAAARQAGDITPDEAIRRMKAIHAATQAERQDHGKKDH
ncbi:MAG: hypothetical protein IH568_02270 [Burkholderiaceae bacterium]|nr:hypothetical protein [Burkholderiaceae bacterium]